MNLISSRAKQKLTCDDSIKHAISEEDPHSTRMRVYTSKSGDDDDYKPSAGTRSAVGFLD